MSKTMNERDSRKLYDPLSQENWRLASGWLVADTYADVDMTWVDPSEQPSDMVIPASPEDLLKMIENGVMQRLEEEELDGTQEDV